MAIFTVSNLTFSNQPTILVGASAAVISLLGVITAILLQGWLKERSRTAAKRLRVFFIIIGVQVVVDWSIPQVSGESHIFGLIMGFLIGSLLLINWKFTD
jgi:rhomboid protease GluP